MGGERCTHKNTYELKNAVFTSFGIVHWAIIHFMLCISSNFENCSCVLLVSVQGKDISEIAMARPTRKKMSCSSEKMEAAL